MTGQPIGRAGTALSRPKRLERFFSQDGHGLQGSLNRLRDFRRRGAAAVMQDNPGLTRADLETYAAGPAQKGIREAGARIDTSGGDLRRIRDAALAMRTHEIRLDLIRLALEYLGSIGQ